MALIQKTVNVTPAASTVTDLYTPGAGRSAVCSSLMIHNDNVALTVNIRTMFAPSGAADTNSHRFYEFPIPPGDTFIATIGLCVNGTDVVRVWSDTLRTNFFLSMQEGP
jgi:hypothetical protein